MTMDPVISFNDIMLMFKLSNLANFMTLSDTLLFLGIFRFMAILRENRWNLGLNNSVNQIIPIVVRPYNASS